MKMTRHDQMPSPSQGLKWATSILHPEGVPLMEKAKGRFIIELHDAASGELLERRELDNLIVNDASIMAARLFRNNCEPNHGINMLSIGTGATGPLLSPDAPDPRQRRLNNEIERKAFSSTTFRDSSGVAVAYPTNIVDFTTTYGEAEAVGPLNEMGLLSTISDNPLTKSDNPQAFPNYDPTIDITPYDVLINYLTFACIAKPSTAILTITWRLTF